MGTSYYSPPQILINLPTCIFLFIWYLIISTTSPISPIIHNNLCLPASGQIVSHLSLYFSCNVCCIVSISLMLKSLIITFLLRIAEKSFVFICTSTVFSVKKVSHIDPYFPSFHIIICIATCVKSN